MQSFERSLLLLLQLVMRHLATLADVLTVGAPAHARGCITRTSARGGGGVYLAGKSWGVRSCTVPYDSSSTIAMGSVRWGGLVSSHQ